MLDFADFAWLEQREGNLMDAISRVWYNGSYTMAAKPIKRWNCINKRHYYSFKIFPRFWLVKTTRIIHHKQLLLTKNSVILNQWRQKCSPLQIIEPLTSKVQPAADYWIIDVKDYWTIDRENLGTRLCHSTKREMAARSLQVWAKIIFWMNNKAIIEFGFRRIWRILQIWEGVIHRGRRPRWITLSSTCRILHILLSLIQ